MQYIGWEEYRSICEEVPEEEFTRLCKRAEIKLNEVTHMRAGRFLTEYVEEQATDFQRQVHGQIKMTMCSLVNAMYTMETSGMGAGISSISNDGYSETYNIRTDSEMKEQITSIIRSGLSGTGLAGAL